VSISAPGEVGLVQDEVYRAATEDGLIQGLSFLWADDREWVIVDSTGFHVGTYPEGANAEDRAVLANAEAEFDGIVEAVNDFYL